VLSAAHVPTALGPPGLSLSGSPEAQAPTSLQGPEHTRAAAQPSPPQPEDPPQPEETSLPQLRAAFAPTTPARSTEPAASPLEVEEPTLWLARAIYSETKLPHEQELVAWVVRNRVETGYRGKDTYREVVLDPYQFSAFNPGSSKRSLLTRLRPESSLPGWRQALWVARYVRHAAPVYRPFSIETRHFYSERSMKKRPVPYWAESSRFVPAGGGPRYTIDERRFRFYEQIS
jgi:hypothetical protein